MADDLDKAANFQKIKDALAPYLKGEQQGADKAGELADDMVMRPQDVDAISKDLKDIGVKYPQQAAQNIVTAFDKGVQAQIDAATHAVQSRGQGR